MIKSFTHCGPLVSQTAIEGESRDVAAYAGHPNGIQLSCNTFLLLFATRGFRGSDDDRSIVAQLRRDHYDGPLVCERLLRSTRDDWQPFDDGRRFVMQCGSPSAFGVPKGAKINGRLATNQNTFAIKWRRCCRVLDPKTGLLTHFHNDDPTLAAATQSVEWMQVRLNDQENDLEILQPPHLLKQKGWDDCSSFCDADVRFINQPIVAPQPFHTDCTEWIDMAHVDTTLTQLDRVAVDRSGIMPLKFKFDPTLGLYEWIETGPVTRGGIFEGGVIPHDGEWLISARTISSAMTPQGGPVAWARTPDPFHSPLQFSFPATPLVRAPLTAYRCADNTVRLITTNASTCHGGDGRDPMHLIDIDPRLDFKAVNQRVIYDSVADGSPIRPESIPSIDMGKLLPHAGGDTQLLVHRVRPTSTFDVNRTGVVVNQQEVEASGIYYAKVRYDTSHEGTWTF